MDGPHIPQGLDSGLEDLYCDPSLLYGSEMTAFPFENEAMLWDVDAFNETLSSGAAKLQSHHASAEGSSRSPTGSSLIYTPTSTQLDFQDVDGFVDTESEETSPVSNDNTTNEDYAYSHSIDGGSNRGNQRNISRAIRNSRPAQQSLSFVQPPHPQSTSEASDQFRQPSFASTSSASMSDSSDQRRLFSPADMELYRETSNELFSNVGGFDAPIAGPSYQAAGLPLRPTQHGDASRTSFGNMAILSQQMSQLPTNGNNLTGYLGNAGFTQYISLEGSYATAAPRQNHTGLLDRDALYMQYLQSMSQNAALPLDGFYSTMAVQPQNLSNHQNGVHTTNEFHQQQELHPPTNVKSIGSNIRASNVNQPGTTQALHPRSKRSMPQQGSSLRATASNPRDHADRVRKGGRSRNSHLSEKSREKSSVMRKVGACWRCAMQRDPCDHGDPCSRCTMRSQRGQTYFFDCDRSKLPDFVHEFLPPSMTIMHQKQTIEDSVASSVLTWDHDNGIDIYLSSGYGPPLRWKVFEFRPKGEEYLRQFQYYQDNGSDQMVRTVNYSPPYGLLKIDTSDDAHLEKYLDQLLEPRFLWEFGWTFYEAESLADDFQAGVLDLMCKLYVNTADDSLRLLLYDILRMLLITFIMGHTLTISEDTVPTVIANIRHSRKPNNYNQRHTSPKLANRQLKFFFAVLRNGIYEKLLKWQQQTLHTAGKKDTTWLPAFCVTLGFAMVLEEVQHTLFLQADASVARNDMTREVADQQASNACERIDARFKLLIGLFQCKYRDKKWSDSGSFGPGTPEVRDSASRMFLGELREMVDERCDHLKSRENVAFSQHNQCYFTSRLTAKFLVPFLNLPG